MRGSVSTSDSGDRMASAPATRATIDDLYRAEVKAELIGGRTIFVPILALLLVSYSVRAPTRRASSANWERRRGAS